ncbi:hypothetical protein M2459_001681 [Parabacteroides sp. PF5-5]|nr:hypothetical protein [Parabacteroides sp. PH5-39]MDH6315970.1 hypothetical protein [Parabacteroides sp. PF5-13]MDH6319627.1 hypothetical protein [Parabacteroides sp. PH5-13]MDH6323358.1 hypothetical protein [Parabacteroides sp. PH5-8]MDH6327133.1 hypothetical protein [Parabacteroides sp. PH5-41]MDH6334935.1 hypothetical protein [Parabacteroides sp. PF5-5]MDH6345999.1 hypothetical protein [Parabacteroides sp. PH5-46]MDH6360983.1 hypothetical protein [Parabacteroides sp. PH5-16]MDH6376650.
MAGFLACPPLCRPPSRSTKGTVAMKNAGVSGLTATGTAPVFHRIPFY